jgi:hypothetical protein
MVHEFGNRQPTEVTSLYTNYYISVISSLMESPLADSEPPAHTVYYPTNRALFFTTFHTSLTHFLQLNCISPLFVHNQPCTHTTPAPTCTPRRRGLLQYDGKRNSLLVTIYHQHKRTAAGRQLRCIFRYIVEFGCWLYTQCNVLTANFQPL